MRLASQPLATWQVREASDLVSLSRLPLPSPTGPTLVRASHAALPFKNGDHREATLAGPPCSAVLLGRQASRCRSGKLCSGKERSSGGPPAALSHPPHRVPWPPQAPASVRAYPQILRGARQACAPSLRSPCLVTAGRLAFKLGGGTVRVPLLEPCPLSQPPGWHSVPAGSRLQPRGSHRGSQPGLPALLADLPSFLPLSLVPGLMKLIVKIHDEVPPPHVFFKNYEHITATCNQIQNRIFL